MLGFFEKKRDEEEERRERRRREKKTQKSNFSKYKNPTRFPAQQIQVINMTVNAVDENPVPGSDVAAAGGKFQVRYTHSQFAENSQLNPTLFTRINQEIATDPRLTSWIPDVGEFGDSGRLRGKNVTTGRPVVEGYTKKPGQSLPLGTGSQTAG